MKNTYPKPNCRMATALAACCLIMQACTWEEFPEPLPELQKPVKLSFTTSVNKAVESGTRVIAPGTDFGQANSFPVSATPYPIGMFLTNPNGSELFDGARNMRAEMTISSAHTDGTWAYYDRSGNQIIPKAFGGKSITLTAYHPWNAQTQADSIPFDFTPKVNINTSPTGNAQSNLLLCTTRSSTIPTNPSVNPIPLGFRNAYTKIVLRVTKRESKDDPLNKGHVTETSIANLTSQWIKNKGGIDPATGYVKSASLPGRIWNDSVADLTTDNPVEFTFLVPAFMDKEVKDGQISFILKIDGENRLFPLKRAQFNTGTDKDGNTTYGFEQNKINTYNLIYNNSILFLSLQSWNSVDANADIGLSAESNPMFEIDLTQSRTKGCFIIQDKDQKEDMSSPYPELQYPKDATQDPWQPWDEPGGTQTDQFRYTKTHVNNTYLSSVLLGGNGSPIQESEGARLYVIEQPYAKLQVSGIDVGGLPVPWQDEKGGLIAKDVCRNYRGNGKSDWRLPRVTEMKAIMHWVLYSSDQFKKFLGGTANGMDKADAVPYWTATEAFMGTPGQIDDQETAWYVQGYYGKVGWTDRNYKVMTRNKQDKAYIRCVREVEIKK